MQDFRSFRLDRIRMFRVQGGYQERRHDLLQRWRGLEGIAKP